MGAEGMVDALKLIVPMLFPHGRLIDLHPDGEPPPLQVRLDGVDHLAGWVREEGEYESYHQADTALATAVEHGWYHRRSEETFAMLTFADTLPDLRAYLAAEWSDAYIEELVALQIENLLQTPAAEKRIVLEERVRIGDYRPLHQ
jgi:hypothetical protein